MAMEIAALGEAKRRAAKALQQNKTADSKAAPRRVLLSREIGREDLSRLRPSSARRLRGVTMVTIRAHDLRG